MTTADKPKTVLIADDDRQLADVLALRMRGLGLHVETTHDALTALTTIHDAQPDLICLDVNMPAGNGLSVCEMLASDPTSAQTPVIVLTGCSDHETIRRCHDMCAYYVLKSPDVWRRVEPLLEELLGVVASASETTPGEPMPGESTEPEPTAG